MKKRERLPIDDIFILAMKEAAESSHGSKEIKERYKAKVDSGKIKIIVKESASK